MSEFRDRIVDSSWSNIEQLFEECKKKMRYGDISDRFSFDELLDYAKIKYKRGIILEETSQLDKAKDDILDAVNIALLAAQRIHRKKI